MRKYLPGGGEAGAKVWKRERVRHIPETDPCLRRLDPCSQGERVGPC